MRPGAFVPSRWRLPECMRRILPVAVTLKRFAAPRCVFNFFFGFEAFLGIDKTLSDYWARGAPDLRWPTALQNYLVSRFDRNCARHGRRPLQRAMRKQRHRIPSV